MISMSAITPEEEQIAVHFSSETAKPILVSSIFNGNKVTVYSSHGEWSNLRRIRDLELERQNLFPDLPDYLPVTPAIWVCFTERLALRYLELAEEWERLMSTSPLTVQDLETMRDIARIELNPSDVIAWTDFDRGYLILRPPPKGAPAALMDVDARTRARLRLDLGEARRQYREYGEWYEHVFEPAVPISKILLPPPESKYRYEDNYRKIDKTKAMPPAFLDFHEDDKMDHISDGIHRINASKDLGYTAIPAVVGYRRTYPPP